MTRKHPLAICEKCSFASRTFAATTGPADAKIAVVSRSPGYYESLNGKSFSGPSGKILDHLLKVHGVDRSEVLATNAVLCQSDGQEDGFASAVACCEPRLEAEIAGATTIIACGREAAYGVLGVSNIASNRGYVHKRAVGDKVQRVIVTNNPAMVLRDDRSFPEIMRDFRLAISPLPTPKMPKVRVIDSVDEALEALPEIVESVTNADIVASDIETRGFSSEIVCFGISVRPERAVVFSENVCKSEHTTAIMRAIYEQPDTKYLWHNGKYDIKALRRNGIDARVDEDTMLVSWCLDERPGDPESGAGGHSLEWLLKDELGWEKYEPPSVRHFKKTGELVDERARDELYEYNGLDTAGCLGLFQVLKERAINDEVWDRPYKLLLIRLSEVLARVELQGNLYDVDEACRILETQVYPKIIAQKTRMRELAGHKINPNSPKQLTTLLYDDWGISHNLSRPRIERLGKSSTDKAVREQILRGDYLCNTTVVAPLRVSEFVQELDNFKALDKQRSTYLEGMVLKVGQDSRIYTDFKIHGTESGRVSSNNPNMQNVTRPKEGLPNIRSTFIPESGCVFLSGDLSQAELRTIAVLSGDSALQSIYLETGRSLHKEIASEFYGDNYTYEQYVRAKNINFGVAYWQSAYTFAQMYHMPKDEAQKFVDFWWARFPDVWKWTKATEQEVMERGELQSPFGHKRRFYVIPADEGARLHVVKQGINFRPQNIAANITLWALCEFAGRVDWSIAQPRVTVHDSILVNCKQEHTMDVAALLKDCMENAAEQSIGWTFPFKADLSVGPNWGNMTELNG